jgi:plasmid segregation protein ParM
LEIEVIEAHGSADCGNSSTKSIVMFDQIRRARKQPTVISYLPTVPNFEDEDLEYLVANLHKNMIVHITSKAVARNGLFAVGEIASVYGGSGFNIKHHKKSERDLTIIQPLTMIAATTIQEVFARTQELPKQLTVNLHYTAAIPVVDYTRADALALEDKLIGEHILIMYVGEGRRVTVTINVINAKVYQEGIPAFYAILNSSTIFTKYNERYGTKFTGRDFAKRKMLFVDIGDGTLELITIIDGKPVVSKSRGHRLGVGHASEKALLAFKSHFNFRADLNRTNFMGKILDKTDKWHDEAKNELNAAVFEQEQKIYDSIADIIENVLLYNIQDIVVFGGGTDVFKQLEHDLISYADKYKMRVLWINGKVASLLNAYGLDELNRIHFKEN